MCSEDHHALTIHSSYAVTASINKLNENNPQAFLTVEGLAAIVTMRTIYPDEIQGDVDDVR